MTTPRRRLWSNTTSDLEVIVSDSPGQQHMDLSQGIEVGLGLTHLAGFSVVFTQVQLLIHSADDESGTAFIDAFAGIGVRPTGMDNGDFSNLALYEGDWLWYQAYQFQIPGAPLTLALPNPLINSVTRSHSSRRISDVGQEEVLVIQHSSAANVNYRFAVQQLWLMP